MTLPRNNPRWLYVALWLAAFVAALFFDQRIAEHLRDHPLVNKHVHLTRAILEIIKLPGWFWTTLCVAAVLGVFHRLHWRAAIALTASGICVGAAYSLLKWITGRHRPDHGVHPLQLHPFAQGLAGLWKEKALCFPSGHACLAFASAASLAILLPRWRAFFYAIATLTALERIVENAHYLSDVVGGIGLGIVVGSAITRLILRFHTRESGLGGKAIDLFDVSSS